MQKKIRILGTFVATPSLLSSGLMSSIQKKSIEKLIIKKDSLGGDDVANKIHHGGEMRVIHHYSEKNYAFLKNFFPDIANQFTPGSFGENIYTFELDEDDLNIGDIYQIGTAKVQLTVSRRPCITINQSYDDNRILKAVMETGHTGWFYRVLEEGEVKVGDYLEFLKRPFPNMPVQKLYSQGYSKFRFDDLDFLKKCLQTGLMDKGWKAQLDKIIFE